MQINKKQWDKVMFAGLSMSNVFYNYAQQDRFSAEERSLFELMWKQWDEARTEARQAK